MTRDLVTCGVSSGTASSCIVETFLQEGKQRDLLLSLRSSMPSLIWLVLRFLFAFSIYPTEGYCPPTARVLTGGRHGEHSQDPVHYVC